ncbi:MAG: hypothetical protein AB1489_18920, partial [Acidobacteriota bacterium]
MAIATSLLIVFMILSSANQFVFAQASNGKAIEIKSPIEVSEFQVTLVSMLKWQTSGGSMGTNPVPTGTTKGDEQLLFTFKCKNLSTKQINVIYWESRFTNTENQLITKQYKTKKKIKAG